MLEIINSKRVSSGLHCMRENVELTVDSDESSWRGSLPCAVRCHAAVVGRVHQSEHDYHDVDDGDGHHGLFNDDKE